MKARQIAVLACVDWDSVRIGAMQGTGFGCERSRGLGCSLPELRV